ncbi:MAG: hypothetical protein ACU0BK_06175 [Shimia sp.]|uniref:hypothetical protein n=1 Tax=Shimia sp. TaxID=1954381 RepID=UPI004058820F
MGRNWRLGDFGETGPFMPEQDVEKAPSKIRKDVHRLMIEAARQMVGGQSVDDNEPKVSPVEAAMLRNAPELVGAPASELAILQAERDALMSRRWPRPRLVSLILVGTLAALMPTVVLRLMIWSLVLFIVAAVAVGPERVRDGFVGFGAWFLRYWQHELKLAQKLVGGGH